MNRPGYRNTQNPAPSRAPDAASPARTARN